MVSPRIEAASHLTDEQFRAAFLRAAIGFSVTDLNGRFLEVNDAYCSLTGYTEAELRQLDLRAIAHPDDLRDTIRQIEALVAGEIPPLVIEKRYVRKDGSVISVVSSVSLVRDQKGQPQYLVRLSQDITDGKRTEEKLKQSESQLAEAQHLAHVGSWNWDLLTNELTWSEELYRIYGQAQDSFTPTYEGFLACVHPEDRDSTLEAVGNCLKSQEPFSYLRRIIRGDGAVRVLLSRGQVICNQQRQVVRMFGACQDITELKQTEDALREVERRYRDIFQNAGEGIFQTTPDGRFATANPALARFLGFASPEDMLRERTDIGTQQYVDPERREEFKRMLEEHDAVRGFEYQAYRKDGEKIWLSNSVRAVRDENGALLYYEGIAEDITERKKAEIRSLAFATLARKLSGARKPLEAARIIVDTADELFGWDSCTFDLYDPYEDLIQAIMAIDVVDGLRTEVPPEPGRRAPTANGRHVIERGARLTLREAPCRFDDDTLRFGDRDRPSVSIMSAPIRHAAGVVGILSIQSYEPQFYDHDALRDLEALAEHCGEALNRIQAEASLRVSEARERAILESALDCIITTDDRGQIVDWNPAAEKTFGYRRDEVIGREIDELIIPPRFREQDHWGISHYLETDEGPVFGRRVEMIALNARALEFPVELAITPIKTEGAPMFTAYLRDITERKRAEGDLRSAKEFSEQLIQTANVIVLGLDMEGKVNIFNQTAEKITGYAFSELAGKSWFETLVPKDKYPRVWEEFGRLIASDELPSTFENPVLTKNGEERCIAWRNNLMRKDGRVVGLISFGNDITEQKRAEEALRESEQRYRDLVENSREFICTHDLDGLILSANPAAMEVLGYDPNDYCGRKTFRELLVPEVRDKFDDYLAVIRRDGFASGITLVQTANGERRVWEYYNTLRTHGVAKPIVRGMARDITERRRAEASLRLFRTLLDQSADAIEVIDSATMRFLDCNESAPLMLGYSREEFLSLSVFDVDPLVTNSSIARTNEEMARSGSVIFEGVHQRKDGSRFPVEINLKLVRLDREYRLAVVRDISERKAAEAALALSEELFRGAFGHAPIGMTLNALDGRRLQVNKAFCEMVGYTEAELLGKEFQSLIHSDQRSEIAEVYQQLVGGNACDNRREWRYLHKDGSVVRAAVSATVVSDHEGHPLYLVAQIEDVRARREAEDALRESEERYRELFENARDAIYVHDLDGIYTSVNGAGEALLGYGRDQILGKNFTDFVPRRHWPRVRENLCRKLREQGETSYEVEVIAKGGHRVPVEVSSRLIYENGDAVGVQGTARDITERERANEVLRIYSRRLIEVQEAERQRIARELHDQIGQVLTAAQINLHAVRRVCNTAEASARVADSIRVLDEALDQVRNLSLDLRPSLLDDLGLVPALRWYTARHAKRTGVLAEVVAKLPDLNVRFPRELETACFRIAQEALTNVARHAQPKRILVQVEKAPTVLILSIEDDGVGFDVSALRQRAPNAETLGLRGMEERVQALGGIMEIDSAPSKGTEIRCTFPLNGRNLEIRN